MIYCRFSSDEGDSHVYAFENTEGKYMILVCQNVFPDGFPRPPSALNTTPEEYAAQVRGYGKLLQDVRMETFTMPLAGQSLMYDTLGELQVQLTWMKQEGYLVPQSALDAIAQQLSEGEKHG